MWYMGGKHRQAKAIVREVRRAMDSYSSIYVEPFAGAMGTASALLSDKSLSVTAFLSDSNPALVTMWQAVQAGWTPPPVTEDDYRLHSILRDPSNPLTAYCEFACSFGGKSWGGFARKGKGGAGPDGLFHPTPSFRHRQQILNGDTRVLITHQDYKAASIWNGAVLYLDPPYAARTNPFGVDRAGFDHGAFWAWAARMSEFNRVLVTEFVAPPDWEVLHDFGDTVHRHHTPKTKGDGTSERIFRYKKGVQW